MASNPFAYPYLKNSVAGATLSSRAGYRTSSGIQPGSETSCGQAPSGTQSAGFRKATTRGGPMADIIASGHNRDWNACRTQCRGPGPEGVEGAGAGGGSAQGSVSQSTARTAHRVFGPGVFQASEEEGRKRFARSARERHFRVHAQVGQ